jgi:hypothetical protein
VDGGVCGAEQVEGVDEGVCRAGQVEVEGLLSTTSRRARLLSRPAILSRRERGLVSSGRDALNMQASNMQGTIEGGTQGTVEGEHPGYRRGRHPGTVEEGIQGTVEKSILPTGGCFFKWAGYPPDGRALRGENERATSAGRSPQRTHQLR